MLVFPIAATVVAAAFSIATWRASASRGPSLRVWSIALAQFAVASLAMTVGIGAGWTSATYRLFYLFGAVLNVVWLGLGTIWLLASRRVASMATGAVIGLSGFAAFVVVVAALVDGATAALASETFPAPSEVMPVEVRIVSRVFSILGSVVLLGGLILSIARKRRVLGLAVLATGVVVAGLASELARAGRLELFSVGLALGVLLMYAGFVRASR